MTLFSWVLNDFKFLALYWPLEAVKGARSGILATKVGSFDSWSKTAYMTLFSWDLNDFKLSGPFLASRGRKRGQKWNFTKNLHTVCSLDSKEHRVQILNFYYVRCARKCLHKDWTSVFFQFSNFKTRIFAFFFNFFQNKMVPQILHP